MLLVGTTRHLEDLDRQLSLAEDVDVTSIACRSDGRRGHGVYVLMDHERIARVDEFELAPVATLAAPDAQCVASTDDRLIVGRVGAHLATIDLRDGSVAACGGFDSIAERDTWENPDGSTVGVGSLAVSARGSWLVNVRVGGVWRSADEGGTWRDVVPPDACVREVAAGADGTVVAAAAVGFGWSVDDGQTWQWTTEGLDDAFCTAVALDGDRVYLSASSGPSTSHARLYRGRVGGGFEQCDGGLPGSFSFDIDTATVSAADGRVAVGLPTGEVWWSTDAGATFSRVTERVGQVRTLRFV
jgi:hypothetical protein